MKPPQTFFQPWCFLQTQMAGDSVQSPLGLHWCKVVLAFKPYLLSPQCQISLEKERGHIKTHNVKLMVWCDPNSFPAPASLAVSLHHLEKNSSPCREVQGTLNLGRGPLSVLSFISVTFSHFCFLYSHSLPPRLC